MLPFISTASDVSAYVVQIDDYSNLKALRMDRLLKVKIVKKS